VVSEVSGYNGAIKAGPGQRSEIGETCVISNGEQSLLITGYERSAEERHLTNFAGSAAREGRVELPAELGKGSMGDHTIRGHPFRAAGAWFRCGDRRPLITIYVKRNPARDQDHDLVQLMRIAQRRFAEMFTCDLGAPPPP
jgi:hypothetical protein